MAEKRNVQTDRFGQEFTIVGCKPNKKNSDFCSGYIEIGKNLYKLEPSESDKDGVAMWIRVTKMDKKKNSGSSANW